MTDMQIASCLVVAPFMGVCAAFATYYAISAVHARRARLAKVRARLDRRQ